MNILVFDGLHLGQTEVVCFVGLVGGIEPVLYYLLGDDFRCGAEGEAEDIGFVPESSAFGRFRVGAEGGPDAGDFVGG
jgi:hypothetical protein